MKPTIIYTKQPIQTEEPKLDRTLLKKKGSSKTFGGWLVSSYQNARKDKNFLTAQFIEEIHKKYQTFQTSEKFKAKQWRGKSGVSYLTYPDYVVAERYRRSDIGGEPKKVSLNLLKEEINRVIWSINKLNEEKDKEKEMIETSQIAELVYSKGWKQVFSTRKQHILLVEILNYLEFRQDIHYSRRGKIKVLGQKKISDF
ncbi:MAG: hypothetical protein KKF48_03770 [Nanoarchaeota archaeon]|nr:hypothetical protein [Nanoarchaeota archaeon]